MIRFRWKIICSSRVASTSDSVAVHVQCSGGELDEFSCLVICWIGSMFQTSGLLHLLCFSGGNALVGRRWGFSLASGLLTPVTQCFCPEGESSFPSRRWLFSIRLWYRNHKTFGAVFVQSVCIYRKCLIEQVRVKKSRTMEDPRSVTCIVLNGEKCNTQYGCSIEQSPTFWVKEPIADL